MEIELRLDLGDLPVTLFPSLYRNRNPSKNEMTRICGCIRSARLIEIADVHFITPKKTRLRRGLSPARGAYASQPRRYLNTTPEVASRQYRAPGHVAARGGQLVRRFARTQAALPCLVLRIIIRCTGVTPDGGALQIGHARFSRTPAAALMPVPWRLGTGCLAGAPQRCPQCPDCARPPRGAGCLPPYSPASILFTSSGMTWKRSPTIPKCAMSKMGALGSELIATMMSEPFMPAWCWMAPEMPQAM